MRNKKVLVGLVSLSSVMLLAACGNKSSQESGKSKDLAVSIVDGQYIVPSDSKLESDDNGYLALKVKITNKTDGSLSIGRDDFTLSDSDDNSIDSESVYDSQNQFKTLNYGKLSKGKSKTGYLVYQVDKSEKKYDLSVGQLYISDGKKTKDEITIPVKISKYKDNTEEIKSLTNQFINQTFLNGSGSLSRIYTSAASFEGKKATVELLATKSKSSKKLSNDADSDKKAYYDVFSQALKNSFQYFKPSDAETTTFIDQYVEVNAKRAKMDVTIKSYFPDSAVVQVKPSVIDLKDMDLTSLEKDYINQHKNDSNSDYQTYYKEAEKYVFDNMHSHYDDAQVNTPKYMPTDGYTLKLQRDSDSGKWKVDTTESSSNYSYDDLLEAFSGGM